jgi:hypothetical protein
LLYLLDKNKKIIAKQFAAKDIEAILQQEIGLESQQ